MSFFLVSFKYDSGTSADPDGEVRSSKAESGRNIWTKLFLGTKDVFNLVSKMHIQSGITDGADVYNLSKYNSRIMAAFLPEYENVQL